MNKRKQPAIGRAASIAERIAFCDKAALEAHAAAEEAWKPAPPPDGMAISEWEESATALQVAIRNAMANETPEHAAAEAWRNALPLMTNRPSVQAYIACAVAGHQRGYIQSDELKTMLYAAQCALSALPGGGAK